MDPLFNRNLSWMEFSPPTNACQTARRWMEFSPPTTVTQIDALLDGVFSANYRDANRCAVGWSFLRQQSQRQTACRWMEFSPITTVGNPNFLFLFHNMMPMNTYIPNH